MSGSWRFYNLFGLILAKANFTIVFVKIVSKIYIRFVRSNFVWKELKIERRKEISRITKFLPNEFSYDSSYLNFLKQIWSIFLKIQGEVKLEKKCWNRSVSIFIVEICKLYSDEKQEFRYHISDRILKSAEKRFW